MARFTDKVFLLSGGARGLGEAQARRLVAEVCSVLSTPTNEADFVGPMARSPQREELYDFTEPSLTCEYSLFVRDDEIAQR